MKLRKIKLFIASIFLAGVSFNANAIIISDMATGYISSGEVDYFNIDTTSYGAGDLTIDLWAYGFNGTYLDSQIYIFENNLSGTLVGSNDDYGGAEAFTDGTTSGLDSYLHINDLAAGMYILAIGSFHLSETEARNGENMYSSGSGYYQITASLDYGNTSVPAPGALLLLATGLFGIGISSRRKRFS